MKKNLILNSTTSLIYQIVYIIYGFITPKLILKEYGSDVNGLISSINQFLSVIALSEFGMTAVVQSALYKPLAEKNDIEISRILTSASKFFRKIGYGYITYIFILCVIYPQFISSPFDAGYIVKMILILCITSLFQYLLGLSYLQLLIADQHVYVYQAGITIATVINLFLCAYLTKTHCSIHALKFVLSLLLLVGPLCSIIYAKIKFPHVNTHTSYDSEPIKQKWNGIAHHFSAYVYSSTDILVLSLLSSLTNVSVYSIYNLVLNGLRQLCAMFDNAVKPVLGKLWAVGNTEKLTAYFKFYEWFIHNLSILIFGCTAVLIVPFVNIYTASLSDHGMYIVPLFSVLMTAATLLQNIKTVYHNLIQSIGLFKETQKCYFITALINVIISIILVKRMGLSGVAIGTLVAVLYQIIWLVNYISVNIIKSKNSLMKLFFADVVNIVVPYVVCSKIPISATSMEGWILYAGITLSLWITIIAITNLIFFKGNVIRLVNILRKKKNRVL